MSVGVEKDGLFVSELAYKNDTLYACCANTETSDSGRKPILQ